MSCGFTDLLKLLETADEFVADYEELGMEELHPVLSVSGDGRALVVELEFIEQCACDHDRQTCMDAFNKTFAPFTNHQSF